MAKKSAELQLTDAQQVRDIGGLTKIKDAELRQGNLKNAKRVSEQIRSYGNN